MYIINSLLLENLSMDYFFLQEQSSHGRSSRATVGIYFIYIDFLKSSVSSQMFLFKYEWQIEVHVFVCLSTVFSLCKINQYLVVDHRQNQHAKCCHDMSATVADFSLTRLFNIAERQLKILRMLKKWRRRRRVGYMAEISIDSERRNIICNILKEEIVTKSKCLPQLVFSQILNHFTAKEKVISIT